jgi:hypothetical protein
VHVHPWVDPKVNIGLGWGRGDRDARPKVVICRARFMSQKPLLQDNGASHRRASCETAITTVNSDDALVFSVGVSEEFLALYRAGVFTAPEIDQIRKWDFETEARPRGCDARDGSRRAWRCGARGREPPAPMQLSSA